MSGWGGSGRHNYPCPVCKKNFEDCPHSTVDVENKKRDDHTRKIVREEIAKARKDDALQNRTRLSALWS